MVKAIVIGSGIAGLASALRLRHKGYDVHVFEANDCTGGKLHVVRKEGYRWDAGPSLFTMPQYVDELFRLFDLDPAEYFEYSRKDTLCHYFWEDGTFFKASGDKNQFIREAADTFGESQEKITRYIERAAEKYRLTAKVFLERSLHKLGNYLSKETLMSVTQSYKLDIWNNLNGLNQNYFTNPKLVQFFNRFATYNGSSPYKTPGIMSMIPHLEMHYGCYYPKGGMHEISQSLYRLAEQQGVQFHLSEAVEEIIHENKKLKGIITAKGTYDADIVVSNMDIFSTYDRLLKNVRKPKRTLRQERSSSALIFYWGIKKSFPQLDLHNIFFSADYKNEFNDIFNRKTICDDPTIYINITSKEDAADAPEGCENWFVMINAPADYGQDWETLIKRTRHNITAKLSRMLNCPVEELIACEELLTPKAIERRTSSHRGSLYGSSSNSKFAAFLRHANFSSEIEKLYFAGGSVHPGGGIPLCLLSAKIVNDLIPEA